MSQLDAQFALAKEIFCNLGEITTRKMFGGGGIYCNGLIFAICDEDKFYIKCDDQNLSYFEAANMMPFYFEKSPGELVPMKYFEMPAEALQDDEEACNWGRLGVEAQERSQLNGSKVKPRKSTK